MTTENWKDKATLVWKGKIIEDLKTSCEFGDFLCEFECDEVNPFRLRVCSRIFIESGDKIGDSVSIPMGFTMDGKLYNPVVENTPLTCLVEE